MRLFMPSLEVGDEEGFTPEKDLFGRKVIGEGLTSLVTSLDQPLVLALDAQWGSGKTTFLKMWAGELRNAGFGVVFFDAFESDYLDDAFTAIAGQIITLARQKKLENDGRAKDFARKAFAAGKILARSALKIGVKAGTAGIMTAEDLQGAASDVSSEVSGLADKYLGERLTRQKEQKEAIEDFRHALSELPSLLGTSDKINGKSKPLIIIIDELDRCRPSFALEVLERIKHFFSVSNVHFVLGVHLRQLENSVSFAYGSNVDSRTYLQKFISLTVNLVDQSSHEDTSSISIFIKHIESQLQLPADMRGVIDLQVSRIAKNNNLSLRTIEKIYTNIAVALTFSATTTFRPGVIIAGLCVLKVLHPDFYMRARDGRITFDELIEPLSLKKYSESESGIERAIDFWRYVTGHPMTEEEIQPYRNITVNFNVRSREDMLPTICRRVIDRLALPK